MARSRWMPMARRGRCTYRIDDGPRCARLARWWRRRGGVHLDEVCTQHRRKIDREEAGQ